MRNRVAMALRADCRGALALLGLLALAAGMGQAQGQTAGVIQFVAGEVKLVAANGTAREARKGVPLGVGDTLATAGGALAQVKMGDGAIVVVQPETRLTVAEFRYAGREDGSERVRYRLQQGGFRAITGAIGRTHKQNYLIETPVAHMGVRGTDHESYYFSPDLPLSAEGAKPGAYNKVNTGRTFIRTDAGEVEIDPNEVGFVASASEVPQVLPHVPGFFNRSVAPRNARPAVNPDPAPTQVAQAGDQLVESGPMERAVRGRGPVSSAGGGTGNGPLVAYSTGTGAGSFGRSGNGVSVALNGAAVVGSSSNNSINWTTWQGGPATLVGGVATNGLVHVIQSTDLTSAAQLAALPVSATYSYSGGPAPSDQAGAQGTVNSLSVGVNFSTQSITSYALDASVGGANWTANGSGSIADFTGAAGIALNGNCAGCSPGAGAPPASGTAHGAFVGSQAQALITTFGLTAAGRSLSGAAYLNRNSGGGD